MCSPGSGGGAILEAGNAPSWIAASAAMTKSLVGKGGLANARG